MHLCSLCFARDSRSWAGTPPPQPAAPPAGSAPMSADTKDTSPPTCKSSLTVQSVHGRPAAFSPRRRFGFHGLAFFPVVNCLLWSVGGFLKQHFHSESGHIIPRRRERRSCSLKEKNRRDVGTPSSYPPPCEITATFLNIFLISSFNHFLYFSFPLWEKIPQFWVQMCIEWVFL